MIHQVVIMMATSGLALFAKEFQNSIAQGKMIGSLLTTIVVFAQQTTGMSVSYIELSHTAVIMMTNEAKNISCALFYDRSDGKLFGRLICSEILSAFIQDYSTEIPQFGPNLRDFKGFHKKMSTVIYYSIRPVISKLESTKGIYRALVMKGTEMIDSQKRDIDDTVDCGSILAHLPMLMLYAEDISKFP